MDNVETIDTPEKKKKKPGCISYGCLTVLVIALVGAVIATSVYFYGKSKVGPYVDRYILAINNQEYEKAYSELISETWRSGITLDEFVEFNLNVKDVVGNYQSKTLSSMHMSTNVGQPTIARAGYNAEFDKGKVFINITLSKKDKDWFVHAINYNSDLFIQALKCQHCGKQNKGLGKFCAFCGKEMRASEEKK